MDRTIWFNSVVSKHNALTVSLVECLGRSEKLYFDSNKIKHTVTSSNCEFGDKAGRLEGFSNEYSYKELYSSDKESVILKKLEGVGEGIQMIHWMDNNLFWVDEIYDDETKKEIRYFYFREN